MTLPVPFDTHCLIIGQDGKLVGKLSHVDLQHGWINPHSVLDDGGCYALYNPYVRRVKIGRSGELVRRWRTLNGQAGTVLVPLIFWVCNFPSTLEKHLHLKFAEHREFYEWFNAPTVIPELLMLVNFTNLDATADVAGTEDTEAEYFTPTEVAARLNVTVKSLAYWRAKDTGPLSIKLIGSVRYPRAEFERWLSRDAA